MAGQWGSGVTIAVRIAARRIVVDRREDDRLADGPLGEKRPIRLDLGFLR